MRTAEADKCNYRERIERVRCDDIVRDETFVMPDFHYHMYYELYYVLQGECRCFIGDAVRSLAAGCSVIIPPESPHYTRYAGACHRFSVYFRKADLPEEVRGDLDGGINWKKPVYFRMTPAWQSDLQKLIDRMDAEERTQDPHTASMMKLLLGAFLIQCVRYGQQEEDLPEDIHSEVEGILRAARYISQNYDRKITQQSLAKISGYSANYFSRRFKETTGIGAHEYLQIIRLKNAAELLRNTDTSILDVALSVGFSDANYFKDAFKKMYGLSPRKYRQSM